VVYRYLKEIRRVLKPGGLARLQFNGLSRGAEGPYDTWAGARFSSSDILEFTQLQDFQVLELEGVSTQYMWTTWRKQASGWQAGLERRSQDGGFESKSAESKDGARDSARIRRITNASSSEPVAPCRGRWATISIWVEHLPADAGLHHLRVIVGDSLGALYYVGPADAMGLQQVNVVLPELEATGLLPVEIQWLGQRICPPATLRVIPPGPSVPRIYSLSDGVNQVAGTRIETRLVKMTLEEVTRPHEIEAWVGGRPVADLEFFCTDPRPQRFEVNFRLPEEIGPGEHPLEVRIGRRKLAPVMLHVVA
jgi:hypothetical protein